MMHRYRKITNKNGYTLVELIIYSVIALVVVGFSLSLVRTTSSNYTRDRRKSRMQTEGRNAILMMAREIINTGLVHHGIEQRHIWVPQALRPVLLGQIEIEPLITHRFKLSDIHQAMEIANSDPAAIKVLLEP